MPYFIKRVHHASIHSSKWNTDTVHMHAWINTSTFPPALFSKPCLSYPLVVSQKRDVDKKATYKKCVSWGSNNLQMSTITLSNFRGFITRWGRMYWRGVCHINSAPLIGFLLLYAQWNMKRKLQQATDIDTIASQCQTSFFQHPRWYLGPWESNCFVLAGSKFNKKLWKSVSHFSFYMLMCSWCHFLLGRCFSGVSSTMSSGFPNAVHIPL